eukprot:GDKK01011003.1.p1 GENE.GDKK01011003.1~~GDKK01011003.1.p1  ORF type:complete len:227 (-),score=46.36 GDKK01011003.1:45-629(-)
MAYQIFNAESAAVSAAKSKGKKDVPAAPVVDPNADPESVDGALIDIASGSVLEPRCRVVVTDQMLIDSPDAVMRLTILKDGYEPWAESTRNDDHSNEIRSRILIPAMVTITETSTDDNDDDAPTLVTRTISARIPGFESPAASCPEHQWISLEYSLNGQHFTPISPSWFKMQPLRPQGDEPVAAVKGAKPKAKK